MILRGMVFPGWCGGAFGRDTHGPKRVEDFGADWIIVRDKEGRPHCATFGNYDELIADVAEWLKETGEMW